MGVRDRVSEYFLISSGKYGPSMMDPLLGHQKSIMLGQGSNSGKLFNGSGYRGTHVAHQTHTFLFQ